MHGSDEACIFTLPLASAYPQKIGTIGMQAGREAADAPAAGTGDAEPPWWLRLASSPPFVDGSSLSLVPTVPGAPGIPAGRGPPGPRHLIAAGRRWP